MPELEEHIKKQDKSPLQLYDSASQKQEISPLSGTPLTPPKVTLDIPLPGDKIFVVRAKSVKKGVLRKVSIECVLNEGRLEWSYRFYMLGNTRLWRINEVFTDQAKAKDQAFDNMTE